MIETTFAFSRTDSKCIERILEDDNAGINHMVLPEGEGLPLHNANSHVYMIVVRGQVALKLDDQEEHVHPAGSLLAIPYRTRMNVYNRFPEVLELFVVKAPSPRIMAARES